MSIEDPNPILDLVALMIQQRAEEAFQLMMRRIAEGEPPRTVIDEITASFEAAYYIELSKAFSQMLIQNFSVDDVRSLQIGRIELSKHLYKFQRMVNANVLRIITDHIKGFTQARDLAMQIYDGYASGVDLLNVKAHLPKYLREALMDPAISQGFAQIVGRIKATNLKTPALKAAYLQAIDALENGVGRARLEKLTRIAWYQRNRYFSNRIAQTELSRAFNNKIAQDLLDDNQLDWVQIRMSVTHPRTDICDYHSKLNMYGQGEGVYPKRKAPKPPFHPHCRCKIIPRYDIDAEASTKPDLTAPWSLMKDFSEYDQRLIAGSASRLERFKNGETMDSIYSTDTNEMYRTEYLDGTTINK